MSNSLNIQGDSPTLLTIDSPSVTIEDLVDKAFYGLRMNRLTGQAFVDVITGDEPIRLPVNGLQSTSTYLNWLWSYNTFRYYFDNNTGRLLMEVL